MKVGLREKFLIPIVVAILIGMAVSITLSYTRTTRAVQNTVRSGIEREVRLGVKQMDHWLLARKLDLDAWAVDPALRDAIVEDGYYGRSARSAAAAHLTDLARAYRYYELLFVANADGTPVVGSEESTQPPRNNCSDRDYFKRAMAGETCISRVLESRYSGRLIFVVATPVRDGERVVGVLAGAVRLSAFNEQFVEGVRLGRHGYACLLDRSGRMISHPEARRLLTQPDPESPVAAVVGTVRQGGGVRSVQDENRLIAGCRLDETGWTFAEIAPLDEAFATARDTGAHIALVGLAVVAGVILVLSILFRRTISARLGKMVAVIERIQKGDLGARVKEPDNSDEVGVVALALNQMSGRLHKTLEELTNEIAERKRAEEELREGEELLRATIESTADALLVVSNDNETITVNAHFAEFSGVHVSRLQDDGKTDALRTFAERVERPEDFLPRAKGLLGTGREEFDTLSLTNGHVLEYYSRPLVRGGEIAGRVWSFRDVTERQRADQALRETRERLHLALRGADLGLWDWDLETGDIIVNERQLAMLGYSPEEIDPDFESWQRLIHPDDLPSVKRALDGHLSGRKDFYESEHRLRTAADGWCWVLSRGKVVERNQEGEPLRMVGTQLDISEWKREKEALRRLSETLEQRVQERTQQLAESVAVYQAIGDMIPYGIWIADAEGRIEYVSSSFLKLVGADLEELKAAGWASILPPEDVERTLQDWRETVRRGGFWDYEHRIRGAGSEEHIVLSRGSPVRGKDGEIVRWVGLNLDITTLKRTEEELRRHKDALETLVEERTASLRETNVQLEQEVSDRQRAEEQVRHLNVILRAVRNVNQLITREKDRISLAQGACDLLTETRGYDTAWIALFDEEGAAVEVVHSGLDGQLADIEQALLGDESLPCMDKALKEQRVITVTDDEHCSDSCAIRDTAARGAAMCTGLRHEEHLYGFMCVCLDASFVQHEQETSLFEEVAGDIAFAFHSIELEERRRLAQESLMTREEQLRLFVEHTPAAVAMFDPQMRYIIASRRWKEDYGLGNERIVGRSHYEVFPEIPQRWKDIHEHCLNGNVETCEEDPFARADGSLDWVRWEIHPWWDSAGEIGGIIMFTEVITRQKEAQEALRASESKYRSLVEQASDGIFIIDREGTILEVNSEGCRVLAHEHDALTGRNINELILTTDEDFIAEQRDRLERGGSALVEHHLLRKDGTAVVVEISAKQLDDGRTQCIVRDITERKRLERELRSQEEQLLQAQKMEAIGRLAGGVAHDFNNLLTAVGGYCDLILQHITDTEAVRTEVRHIQKAEELASSVTRKLLAFSRKQVFQPQVVNVNEVVSGFDRILERIIGEDVKIETHLEQRIENIKADPQHMEQILLNLAVNARDSMAAGGRLTIRTENVVLTEQDAGDHPDARPGAFVRLSVADTGTGIDEDMIDRIFEPFFTTKGVDKGTGLGLSTVYGIVKQHQGWITVQSELGEGSCFQVYLPVTAETQPHESRFDISAGNLGGGGERILLIEDEGIVREFATKALTVSGYEVVAAGSAAEALELFEQEDGEFALIFSDIVLPDIPGMELIEELLQRRPGIPVICSSGYTDRKSYFSVIKERGFRFLAKPYSMKALLRNVKELLHSDPHGAVEKSGEQSQ